MTHPETEVWLQAGLSPRAAKALAKAGILSPDDLWKRGREEVLALKGLGKEQLRKCEQFLGHEIPSRPNYWIANGCPATVAAALSKAGLQSIEDVEGMTREQLLFLPEVGEVAVGHCERMLGRALPSAAPYWIGQGFGVRIARALARAGLQDFQGLRKMSQSDFRRIGLTEKEIRQTPELLLWRGGPNLDNRRISDAAPLR